MAQVIVEFVGDASGLKPIEQTLDNINKEVKETQTEAGKTAQKLKEIPKALAGKEITDFGKNLQTATQKANELATKLAQLRKEGKANTDEFKNLQKELSKIDTGTQFTGLVQKAVSLKTELRNIKAEMATLSDEGSPEFQKLAIEAAKLEDKIGDVNQRVRVLASDTFAFDAVVDGVKGITAAFTVAQGAAGLFGEESEDIQKAMLKVQSATALFVGVQELANQVTGQGAAKLGILKVAQEGYALVVGNSTGALKAFRIALAATGIGLFVVGIGILIDKLGLLKESTYDAAEAQSEFAKKIEQANKELQDQANLLDKDKESYDDLKKRGDEVFASLSKGAKLAQFSTKDLSNAVSVLKEELDSKSVIDFGLSFGTFVDAETQFKKFTDETIANIKRLEAEIAKRTEGAGRKQGKEIDIQVTAGLDIPESKKQIEGDIIRLKESLGGVALPLEVKLEMDRINDLKKTIRETALEMSSIISDTLFTVADQNRDAQFDAQQADLERRKNAELSNKELTEQQKAVIDKKYAREQAKLRQQQFEQNRQAAISQATINGAIGVATAAATPGTIPQIIARIALITATTAAQVAIIARQQPPKFEKGGEVGGKLHAHGGTIIEAEKGEFVVNRKAAMANKGLLEAINNNKLPQVMDILQDEKGRPIVGIDPDAIGLAVAKAISKHKQVHINIDEKGFTTHLQKGNEFRELMNKRFSN